MRSNRDLRWNDFNLAKVAKHGVTWQEAERVVQNAASPYPRRHKKGTWLVRGRGSGNRRLQVIFVIDDWDDFYVIHAMPVQAD